MKVLLTTDGSPDAFHAIREAIRLLPLREADVIVLAVANPLGPIPAVGATGGMGVAFVDERLEEIATADLTAAVGLLQGHGIAAVLVERIGDPAAVILEVARASEVDVIVLGRHNRGAWQRWLLGSVTDALSHTWHGAMLVVQPEQPAEAGR